MERHIHLECMRGIAAIMVLIAHFCQAFLPRFFDANVPSHGFAENFIATSVLNLFVNANFAVCFFFVLSGYVLSQRSFGHPDYREWLRSSIKRYPRLAIPSLVSVIGAWLAIELGGAFYGQSLLFSYASMPDFYKVTPTFIDMLRDGLWSPFVSGSSTLNPVLWTMRYELIGSLLVFAFCHLFSHLKVRWLIYAACLFLARDSYYLAFVLGVMLHELSSISRGNNSKKTSIILFLAMIVFSSYPYYGGNQIFWTIPNEMAKMLGITGTNVFSHIIGATLLLVLVQRHISAQQFLSGRGAMLLGQMSFPIYLVHFPILLTLSSYCIVQFHNLGYGIALIISLICSLIAVLFLSYAMLYFVEKPALQYINRYAHQLTKKILPIRQST